MIQNEIDTSTFTFRRGLFCDTSERLCRERSFPLGHKPATLTLRNERPIL
ncbi:YcgJ family protein [Citrobacter braakii]|nr:hypothetical protein [Citrobacter braakii]HEE9875214.1 hypothetical protein [Citrobacter braakii]